MNTEDSAKAAQAVRRMFGSNATISSWAGWLEVDLGNGAALRVGRQNEGVPERMWICSITVPPLRYPITAEHRDSPGIPLRAARKRLIQMAEAVRSAADSIARLEKRAAR